MLEANAESDFAVAQRRHHFSPSDTGGASAIFRGLFAEAQALLHVRHQACRPSGERRMRAKADAGRTVLHFRHCLVGGGFSTKSLYSPPFCTNDLTKSSEFDSNTSSISSSIASMS